ncbi:RNA polymerase sigma factor SigX [Lentibacillus halophilus]|uniref:RNA polymerase sigma factor n=1 Tax=Lentibacillus halophilus TaxID=295065 RepID=A0ABN0Z4C7_9BACI
MDERQTVAVWFDEYGNDIYHFLIYRVGPHEAEDLLQEVFIKALKRFHSYQKKSGPKTWLFSVARNVAIDEIRRQKARKWKDHIPLEKTKEPETNQSPQSIFAEKEEYRIIYQAIRTLKANYQDVLILRGIKELSINETADILKWSENKVRLTQHRARIALNNTLRGWDTHDKAK